MKKPTLREQVEAFNKLALDLKWARCVKMDESQVIEILNRLTRYANAFDDLNGERTGKEVSNNVASAFRKHIQQKE